MSKGAAPSRHVERRKVVRTIRVNVRFYLHGRGKKVDRSLNKLFGFVRSYRYDPWTL